MSISVVIRSGRENPLLIDHVDMGDMGGACAPTHTHTQMSCRRNWTCMNAISLVMVIIILSILSA